MATKQKSTQTEPTGFFTRDRLGAVAFWQHARHRNVDDLMDYIDALPEPREEPTRKKRKRERKLSDRARADIAEKHYGWCGD